MLIDWSQNDEHKTTVGVYSLRARERPTVSTPLDWDEVERRADALVFEASDVLERVEEHGDLFAPVAELEQRSAATSELLSYAFGYGPNGRLVSGTTDRAPRGGRGAEEEPPFDAAALSAEMEGPRGGLHAPGARRARAARRGRRPRRLGDVNLDALAAAARPRGGAPGRPARAAGPLAGALRLGAEATLAAEAGLVMGYLSQRVLGQYDVSLLGADTDPRLLFVGPNLAGAVRDLDVDREAFGRWVCAHELTHVFQFQGVPWLREHLGGLLREYVATVEVRIESGAARRAAVAADPARLVEAFREGGLAALVQNPEQRAMMDGSRPRCR